MKISSKVYVAISHAAIDFFFRRWSSGATIKPTRTFMPTSGESWSSAVAFVIAAMRAWINCQNLGTRNWDMLYEGRKSSATVFSWYPGSTLCMSLKSLERMCWCGIKSNVDEQIHGGHNKEYFFHVSDENTKKISDSLNFSTYFRHWDQLFHYEQMNIEVNHIHEYGGFL